MKKVLFILAALIIIGSPVVAFHDSGVAHCNGCHTMHNSQDGALVDADSPNGNPWLLVDATPSDVCIACHDHIEQTLGTDPLAPPPLKGAGNFVYLLEDNLNDGHEGGLHPISGDAAGHNVVAPGHGIANDATLNLSPGGGFPAGLMSCTSCHDPHGTQDFRFLYGAGRLAQNFFPFTNPAPTAEGLSMFFGAESPTSHTAYQGGMSAWCGNCHGMFHNEAGGRLEHPSGSNLGANIALTYGLYNGSDAILTGDPTLSYLPEVPFEDPAATTGSTAGPSASSQVSCITCHRAHATSAPDAGRWDFNVTFLHEDGLESLSYPIPNPYNYTQRSLCNKCHKKDEFDLIVTP